MPSALLDTPCLCLGSVSALVAWEVKIPIGIDAAMNDYQAALSIAKAGRPVCADSSFRGHVEFYGGIINTLCPGGHDLTKTSVRNVKIS